MFERERSSRVAEVARLFSWLGWTAFGGPVAHVAAMEDACVRERRWLSSADFADLVGATQLIPGPNSTELAMHLGYRRAGWAGFWVAGVSFLVPAVLLVWGIAWGYVTYGARVEVQAALAGMQPVVLAVVVQALWRMHASLIRSRWAGALAAVAFVGSLIGVGELRLVACSVLLGGAVGVWRARGRATTSSGLTVAIPAFALPSAPALLAAASTVTPWMIGLAFARIGSVLFGSGYVLLSFLRAEFGPSTGLLTDAQLLDAIAVGQVTPGPVFSAATFVGFLLAGHAGAAAATIGIFAPAFVAVAASAPFLVRLRAHPVLSVVLDAVNAVSFALMGSVVVLLAVALFAAGIRTAPTSIAIFFGASAVLLRTRIGSGWVLLAGAALGLVRLF